MLDFLFWFVGWIFAFSVAVSVVAAVTMWQSQGQFRIAGILLGWAGGSAVASLLVLIAISLLR